MQRMTAKSYRKAIPESAELSACLDICKQAGIVAWRSNAGVAKYDDRVVRFGFKGLPDICGYVPTGDKRPTGYRLFAYPFFWEVKRKGKKPTMEQRWFIEEADKSGCLAGWGTADDLIERLRKEWNPST